MRRAMDNMTQRASEEWEQPRPDSLRTSKLGKQKEVPLRLIKSVLVLVQNPREQSQTSNPKTVKAMEFVHVIRQLDGNC